MADEGHGTLPERVHHTHDVGDVAHHAVVRHGRGLRRASIAAHVHGYGAVARFRQRRHLIAPGVPGLGEAVDHQNRGAFSQGCQVNARSRGIDDTVFHLAPHAEAAPGSWVAICPTGAWPYPLAFDQLSAPFTNTPTMPLEART